MKITLSKLEFSLVGLISIILVVVVVSMSKTDDAEDTRPPRQAKSAIARDDVDESDNAVASFTIPADGRTVGEVTGALSSFSLADRKYDLVAFTDDGIPYYVKDGSGSLKGLNLDSPGLTPDRLPASLDSLKALTQLQDPDRRTVALVMQNLSTAQLPEALALVQSMVWGPQALTVMNGLMARWGELDPAQAMEHAKSLASRRASEDATRYALKGWATSDPEAALAWFTENSDTSGHSQYRTAQALFSALAKNDLAGALESAMSVASGPIRRSAIHTVMYSMTKEDSDNVIGMYESMPSGDDKDAVGMALLRQWRHLKPGMQEAFDLFDKMESDKNKQYAASMIAHNWAVYQPEMVAEWVTEMDDGKTKSYASERLLDTWTRDQPEGAANWVSQLSGEEQPRQIERVVSGWARTDPESAEAWFSTFDPSPRLDDATLSFSRALAWKDPAKGAEWAKTITDEEKRSDATYTVAKGWLRKDFKEATVFIAGADLSDSQKKRLLENHASPAEQTTRSRGHRGRSFR